MNTNNIESRKKPRMPCIAQLDFGVDDDLIAWLSSYGNGEKQSAIKALLRRGLQVGGDVKSIAGKRGRRRHVDEPQLGQSPSAVTEELAYLRRENERLQAALSEWIAFMNNRFEQVINGGLDTDSEPIQSVSDLDATIKAKRELNIDKAQW